MFPMWIFSGVFFSYERFPEAALPAIRALPLTALVDALRRVMLDGAGLVGVVPSSRCSWLGLRVSFLAALKLFRWQ